jgi:hypothetical protein
LLWNEKFQDFLTIKFDAHYSLYPLWRIWLVYYGGICLAVATGLYSYYCPKPIKNHGSAFDLANSECQHLAIMDLGPSYLEDVKKLEAGCTAAERALFPPDRPRDDFILHMRGKPEEPAALASLVVYAWRVHNIKRPALRPWLLAIYSLGLVLLAVPAGWTFLQVTLSGLRHWL